MTYIHFRLVLMCTYIFIWSIVQVKAQICYGVPQYSGCSTNPACGCLHMVGASDTGVCGFLYGSCSDLVACQPSSNACFEPDHICVHHPRCHFHPVCFPVSMMDRRICPPTTTTNTTATTTTTTTATSTTTSTAQSFVPLRAPAIDIHPHAKWTQNGLTVAGGNGQGNGINQLDYPLGLFVDDDRTVYVADQYNHRIIERKYDGTSSEVAAGGNGQGNGANQFNYPLDVIVDKARNNLIICDWRNNRVVRWPRRNGTSGEIIISNIDCRGLTIDQNESLYIVDHQKHEVRRYRIGDIQGTVVAGGNGNGTRADQLSSPHYVFVDRDHSVYVSDYGNHRVMKWEVDAKQGIVVAGGQGEGNNLTQLNGPLGVAVDQMGTVYVTDHHNHRIMCWPKQATQGRVIAGGNGWGGQSNQLYRPFGFSFDRYGNLYVADFGNHRVQKFNIEETTSS